MTEFEKQTDGQLTIWAKQWTPGHPNHDGAVKELIRRRSLADKEGIGIAKSAKNAAWVAAICAIIALVISIVALFVSLSTTK